MQPQKTVPAPPPDALPEPALLLRAIPGTGGAIPPAVYRRAQRQEPAQSLAETEEDGEETESFVPVEDETLAQKLVDIFNTKMADEEKEDE